MEVAALESVARMNVFLIRGFIRLSHHPIIELYCVNKH